MLDFKIIIFGSHGMLGQYVSQWLSKKYHIINITRKEFDVLNYVTPNAVFNLETFLVKYALNEKTIVINCIGLIPQTHAYDPLNYIYINSTFPSKLSDICNKYHCKLIHPTTDCVFNGKQGYPYTEKSIRNENSMYGTSKMLGENIDACIIRTSIIGEQLYHAYSLLEVVKSRKNGHIKGYTNHYWNGITCLQFAKIIDYMIEHDIFWKGIRHLFSPRSVSKYELVECINLCYNLNIDIEKTCTDDHIIDKSLSTNYMYHDTYQLHNLNKYIPDIQTQIKELTEFQLQ